MGEIKTVIDEAETQNIAMNSIYLLKVQEAIYKLYSFVYRDSTPTFMHVKEYSEKPSDELYSSRRPDLLNRIENFLISMSHSFDQHIDEQLKQMRELKEQVVIIMQQMDVLKKKLLINEKINELKRSMSTQPRFSRLIDPPEIIIDEVDDFVPPTRKSSSIMRNISF